MERIDLEKPLLSQARTLKVVKSVNAKDLQNWNDLHLLEAAQAASRGHTLYTAPPGARRLYSGLGNVVVAFMGALKEQRLRPGIAVGFAQKICARALKLYTEHPATEQHGRLVWSVNASEPDRYLRGYIVTFEKEYRLIDDPETASTLRGALLFGDAYITIEIDHLILRTFNRIHAQLAGFDLTDPSWTFKTTPMG